MVSRGGRQPPDARFVGQSFGHGPTLENAVLLQAEIVAQPAGSVLLDDKASRCLCFGHSRPLSE